MVLDRKIALVLMVLTGFFYYLTYFYPPETMTFPRFLLYTFGILSALLFLFPGKKKEYEYRELFAREKIITFVAAVVYVSLLEVIGFFAMSVLFVLLYIWGFERRAVVKAVLLSVAFSGTAYLVFSVMLNLSFPRGILM